MTARVEPLRAVKALRLGVRLALVVSIATGLAVAALAAGWIDSAPQAAAMLWVIVVFGLVLLSVVLHLILAIASIVVGRSAGWRQLRSLHVYLFAAVVGCVALAILVLAS